MKTANEMVNYQDKAYAVIVVAGLFMAALLLAGGTSLCANETEIPVRNDFRGKILVHIRNGSDHNFVLPLPSAKIIPLRKEDEAGISKERFLGLFEDFFKDRRTRQQMIVPKLEEALNEKNVALLQEWANYDYGIAASIREEDPLPPGEKDEFMGKFIDIRSKDGSVLLEHVDPENFFPNAQMTHAVFAYNPGIFPRNKQYEKIPLLDLKTLEASPLNIESVGDEPGDIFQWSPDGKYLAISVTTGTERLAYRLAILDVQADEIKCTAEFENRIDSIAWSPDSKCISVISVSSRPMHGPLGWLLAYAGHAVPYNTFYLEIMSLEGGTGLRFKVEKDVSYGWSTLLWID